MAGIAHCIYFRCLMNGSSSLAESDRRPLHLCPIDLRKLQWLIGFDFAERYGRLQTVLARGRRRRRGGLGREPSAGRWRTPALDAGLRRPAQGTGVNLVSRRRP